MKWHQKKFEGLTIIYVHFHRLLSKTSILTTNTLLFLTYHNNTKYKVSYT